MAAQRPFVVPPDELPIDITFVADGVEQPYQTQVSVKKFREWAREYAPELEKLIVARVTDGPKPD